MVFDVCLSMEHFYEILLPFLNHLNTQQPSVTVGNESQRWPLQVKGHALALIYPHSSFFSKETRPSLTSVKHSPYFVSSASNVRQYLNHTGNNFPSEHSLSRKKGGLQQDTWRVMV